MVDHSIYSMKTTLWTAVKWNFVMKINDKKSQCFDLSEVIFKCEWKIIIACCFNILSAFYKRTQTNSEQTMWFHLCKIICLDLVVLSSCF